MWLWRRKKNNLTTEYNALTESKKRIDAFERKYNISSVELYNKTCNMDMFEGSDKYLWETYIRSYLRCGGHLEKVTVSESNYEDNLECSTLKNEMMPAKLNNDIKKEATKMSLLFLLCKIC